jgi:hypothetical protein
MNNINIFFDTTQVDLKALNHDHLELLKNYLNDFFNINKFHLMGIFFQPIISFDITINYKKSFSNICFIFKKYHHEDKNPHYIYLHDKSDFHNEDIVESQIVNNSFNSYGDEKTLFYTIPIINEDNFSTVFFKLLYTIFINNKFISITPEKSSYNMTLFESNISRLICVLLEHSYISHLYKENFSKFLNMFSQINIQNNMDKYLSIINSFQYISFPLFFTILTIPLSFPNPITFVSNQIKQLFQELHDSFCSFRTKGITNIYADLILNGFPSNQNEIFSLKNIVEKNTYTLSHTFSKILNEKLEHASPTDLIIHCLIYDFFIKKFINKYIMFTIYNINQNFFTDYLYLNNNIECHFIKNFHSLIRIGNSGVGKTYLFYHSDDKSSLKAKKINLSIINEDLFLSQVLDSMLDYYYYFLTTGSYDYAFLPREHILIDEFNRENAYLILKKFIHLFDLNIYNFTQWEIKVPLNKHIITQFSHKITNLFQISKKNLFLLDNGNHEHNNILNSINNNISSLYYFLEDNNNVINFPLSLTPYSSWVLTMNPIDRNTFEIDSFWTRRFLIERISLDNKSNDIQYSIKNGMHTYDWDVVRHFLNKKMTNLNIPQDKHIGFFFWNNTELIRNISNNEKKDYFIEFNIFKNKIVYYLYYQVLSNGSQYNFSFNEIDSKTEQIFNSKFIESIMKSDSMESLFKNWQEDNINEPYFKF